MGKKKIKGIFKIRIFWVKNGKIINPKCAFLAKSVFVAVQGAFLHGSSRFLVCKLLAGGERGRFNDFFKIHSFRVKNGKISNRKCAFLA